MNMRRFENFYQTNRKLKSFKVWGVQNPSPSRSKINAKTVLEKVMQET